MALAVAAIFVRRDVTATAWVIALLLISITLLAVIVAIKVYGPVWSLLLPASI